MNIWQHTDEDGDHAYIGRNADDDPTAYRLHIPPHDEYNGRTVHLDQDELSHLHAKIGEELTNINLAYLDAITAERDRLRDQLKSADHQRSLCETRAKAVWKLTITPDAPRPHSATVTVGQILTALGHEEPAKITNSDDGASVLGSSRRAQEANHAEVQRLAAGLAAMGLDPKDNPVTAALNAIVTRDVDLVRSMPRVPSQGQDIPADQLNAVLEDAHATGQDSAEWARQVARIAYRLGYAAALGYEIEIEDGRLGVGDRPEPAPALDVDEADELHDDPLTMADELRVHLRAVTAERNKARETLHTVIGQRDQLRAHLDYLCARTRYGVALTSHAGRIVVFGFHAEQAALDTGRTLADALANYQGVQVDATLIEPGKLAEPPVVNIDELLAATRAALLEAVDDGERAEAVEELLEGWYGNWPDTALVSPHQPIAGELIRLLAPGPVTLTVPRELLGVRPVDLVDADHRPDLWANLGARLDEAPLEPATADEQPETSR